MLSTALPVLLANAAWVVFLSVWALAYFGGSKGEQQRIQRGE